MRKRKVRNIILKTVAYIMGFLFLYSICAMDSETYFFYIMSIVTGTWLALFGYANGVFEEGAEYDT